ncbi:hypothetical protein [Alkaliphilus sp. B6464]|uniref:hypothetical protein n=1 Tax=Alkaliphilus sp. B6464 TaxID=2731219 RepID=UPI001BAC8997|nr:hypothetical protein [Alkaliphilus sp. B6464]QUH21371.1 hypothetical protein HYG84_16770 [Alkaliphilus sp. B6464]
MERYFNGRRFKSYCCIRKRQSRFISQGRDYLMLTLSFKDRCAVVLISKAKELGIKNTIIK